MRMVIVSCAFLLCVQAVQAQPVPNREHRIGNGKIVEVAFLRQAPLPPVKEIVREPAPYGKLNVREWHYDGTQRYPLWLTDTAGNDWYVGFQSSQENFASRPSSIQGWIMIIEGGCLRIGTLYGSYLLSSKDMQGKGIPPSFVIQSGAAPAVKSAQVQRE